jgi:predicted ATPase
MRLLHLGISNFKNLNDFSIDFDEEESTSVLVGRNGTGKSNLLEAIVIIFRDLDLDNTTPFKYSIKYRISNKTIQIESDPEQKSTLVIMVNDEKISLTAFRKQLDDVLPRFVFGYYSGPSNRLEEHFDAHQKRFYSHLISTKQSPAESQKSLRRLFYTRLIHSQFVLLAFFLQNDAQLRTFLHDELRIEDLDSVLFVVHQPPWNSKDGDPRFWNARGEVADFLENLYKLALAPLRIQQNVPLGFRKKTKKEHLYLYIKNKDDLSSLTSNYPSPQSFFTALESTYISELISDVRIRVKVRGCDGSLTQRELSEGEQQLLLVLGLMRFTAEDESLFLLDEPDTHLNPAWSLKFTHLIDDAITHRQTIHTIMATHDPLVVAGLNREQVRILDKDDNSGTVTAQIPSEDPKGMGVAGLLTSDVYGLRSQLDLDTLHALDKKRMLASKDELTASEEAELRDLDATLSALDFTRTTRDPLYELFAKAVYEKYREADLDTDVLSPEQWKQRVSIAKDILDQLESKQ